MSDDDAISVKTLDYSPPGPHVEGDFQMNKSTLQPLGGIRAGGGAGGGALVPVICTGNLNGARAVGVFAAYSAPVEF